MNVVTARTFIHVVAGQVWQVTLSLRVPPRVVLASVLCYVAEHCRPVEIRPKERQTQLESLVEAVKIVFSDVIGTNSELILQLKSEVWKGEFVDIGETDVIADEAIVRAIIKEEPSKVRIELLKSKYTVYYTHL